MAIKIFPEKLTGKYDGNSPAVLLAPGSLSDGKNIRKVGEAGGWKPRKGSMLVNTTAIESGSEVNSIHYYKNPIQDEYHLICQANSKLIENATPLTQSVAYGNDLAVACGTTPGFSAVVKETLFYADGSSRPIAYSGSKRNCTGFIVYDADEKVYMDFTLDVTDRKSNTVANLGHGVSDVYYVCSPEKANKINLTFGTNVNENAVTPVVSAWRLISLNTCGWVSVGATDGTKTTQTHDTDGSFEWTTNSADKMSIIAGVQGYWYRVSWGAAVLGSAAMLLLETGDKVLLENDDDVLLEQNGPAYIASCTISHETAYMTNKWDGTYNYVAGAYLLNNDGVYEDILNDISVATTETYLDLSSATTASKLYLKTLEPAMGFGFGIIIDKDNASVAEISTVDTWDGDSFESCNPLSDGTLDTAEDSSFSTTGILFFDAAQVESKMRTLQGDPIAGYWYEIEWSDTLEADTHIYEVVYAAYPKELDNYDGCVEFQGQLVLWGDSQYPNRLRKSPYGKPDYMSGSDTFSNPFGDDSKILLAKSLYENLIIWKENSIWSINKNYAISKLTDTVGIASPQTGQVAEVGLASMKRDELVNVAIWQAADGVYVLDGSQPRKISQPVDHYFNAEHATCISASDINNLSAYIDKINNEYHLLLPTVELVYNFKNDEWYPPWEREQALTCGLGCKGTDNRNYTFGGTSGGFVLELESSTSDKSTANAPTAITHQIKTRAIGASTEGSASLTFTLRDIWAEFKAQSSGSITTKLYKDMATSGTTLATPSAMTLVNAGYNISVPTLSVSEASCTVIQLEFISDTLNQEMEIWNILYMLEALGLIEN